MNPLKIIKKYYTPATESYEILLEHSRMVAKKALETAKKVKELHPDLKFIEEAAMLHDIGIFLTKAPEIGCFGKKPYVCHGYLGREILEKEGLLKHGLVCERHIGVGISKEDVVKQNLPLPQRDMMPISLEEKIVSFADKFFSKNKGSLQEENSLAKIKQHLSKHDKDKVKIFEEWLILFKY